MGSCKERERWSGLGRQKERKSFLPSAVVRCLTKQSAIAVRDLVEDERAIARHKCVLVSFGTAATDCRKLREVEKKVYEGEAEGGEEEVVGRRS
jgi:hypothetical protein